MNKKIFTFALAIISFTAFGQFKKISGKKGEKLEVSQLRLVNSPVTESSMNKEITSTFEPKAIAGTLLKNKLNPSFSIVQTNEMGLPAAIYGNNLKALKTANPQVNAISYLTEVSKVMKIQDAAREFIFSKSEIDELGITHMHLNQYYKGVPVHGGEVILHGKNADFDFLNGRYFPTPNEMDVVPVLSLSQAEGIVIADAGDIKPVKFEYLGIFNMEQIKSELTIYHKKGVAYLAYHHTMYKNLLERWEYYVDAKSGVILHKHESFCKFHNHHSTDDMCEQSIKENENATITPTLTFSPLDGKQTATAIDLLGQSRSINTWLASSKFYLIDGSRDMFNPSSAMPNEPEGSIWTIDAFNTSPENNNFNYDHVVSNNNAWSSPTSVSAHFNGGKAFEYYKNIFSRNSINGDGGNIVDFINVADSDGSSFGNAFWNGAAMFYGNGDSAFKPLARGLDVAGHEMTHGVVQSTANLEYEGESGALNESFADVFGVMIDRDDWLIGEDVVKTSAFPSGALRSMQDPHNGASTGDFGSGWQPKHVNEKYTGTEDNGGVHINSGIPNFAFFIFANNAAVGKDKAEKVYYRALTNYLTKSSQFIDARIAVEKAATDLFGTGDVLNAAKAAFATVGIAGGSGGNYETDIQTNDGSEFILATDQDKQDLYLVALTPTGEVGTISKISESDPISKPSVRDNGSEIVFVASDNLIHIIQIDWNQSTLNETSINFTQPIDWRNAVISKDGFLIAATTLDLINEVIIIDRVSGGAAGYELNNPTFTEGVTTGDVLYADAMEFDASGEFLMYDAENEITSNTSGTISYWDISFIKVWDNNDNTFAEADQISKLFNGLDEGESVGNPTFSKNSPYIIAFDYLNDNQFSIKGVNIEKNNVDDIVPNNSDIGYPNYSVRDNKVVYDRANSFSTDINIIGLDPSKITGNIDATFLTDGRWAVWFSNGNRVLSDVKVIDNDDSSFILSPNPTKDMIHTQLINGKSEPTQAVIYNTTGAKVKEININEIKGKRNFDLDVSTLNSGTYYLSLMIDHMLITKKFIKI